MCLLCLLLGHSVATVVTATRSASSVGRGAEDALLGFLLGLLLLLAGHHILELRVRVQGAVSLLRDAFL